MECERVPQLREHTGTEEIPTVLNNLGQSGVHACSSREVLGGSTCWFECVLMSQAVSMRRYGMSTWADLGVSGSRIRLTCRHDARGGHRQHRDVLGAVGGVQVRCAARLPPSLRLRASWGDGEESRLIVGRRGRREGGRFLLLLLHLVQKHGIFNMLGEKRLDETLTELHTNLMWMVYNTDN